MEKRIPLTLRSGKTYQIEVELQAYYCYNNNNMTTVISLQEAAQKLIAMTHEARDTGRPFVIMEHKKPLALSSVPLYFPKW